MGSCIGKPIQIIPVALQSHQNPQANNSKASRVIQIPLKKLEIVLQPKVQTVIEQQNKIESSKQSQKQLSNKEEIKLQIAKLIAKSKNGLIILREDSSRNNAFVNTQLLAEQNGNNCHSDRVHIQFQTKAY